jgi:hypothetical protein
MGDIKANALSDFVGITAKLSPLKTLDYNLNPQIFRPPHGPTVEVRVKAILGFSS